MYIAYTTFNTEKEAAEVCQNVIKNKLAACCNLIKNGTSYFFWEGKVQSETEIFVIFKTSDDQVSHLEQYVLRNHSYDCPCFWAIKAEKVSTDFERWLDAQTQPS